LLTRKMRTGIVFSLVLAFVVTVAIAFYADMPHMLTALARFRWQLLPLILGLTLLNYLGRFIKWQYYLKRLAITISLGKSLLIFLSGLSMAITPGKVGELLKSYLLKRSTGVAISRTSPIILSERLTDGIAMLALATAGLVFYRFGWEWLLALLVTGFVGIAVIQNRRLALTLLHWGERLPGLSRIAHWLRAFYESSYILLQWRPLLLAVCIGILSWSGECLALYLVYSGLGIPASADLLLKAMFIMAVSSLVGSASGLPGGLGTADGSMLGLTRVLITTSAAVGGAATLLIRLCTLWFGLVIGAGALLAFRMTLRTAISAEQRDTVEGWNHTKPLISPTDGRQEDTPEASLWANTGETVV
jgi:glycosyltransferase 2 family protein